MKKQLVSASALFLIATAAFAQSPDATKAYIDAGFSAMDFNKDGKITRSEFDRFMKDRLEKQKAVFDTSFSKLDANGDGNISLEESAKVPLLAEHFMDVDSDADGFVNKAELRTAMLKAQAHEQGLK